MSAFSFRHIDEITAVTSTVRRGFRVHIHAENTARAFQLIDMEFLDSRFLTDEAVKAMQIDNASVLQVRAVIRSVPTGSAFPSSLFCW